MKTVLVAVIVTVKFNDQIMGEEDMLQGFAEGMRCNFTDDIDVTDVSVTEVINRSKRADIALLPVIAALEKTREARIG